MQKLGPFDSDDLVKILQEMPSLGHLNQEYYFYVCFLLFFLLFIYVVLETGVMHQGLKAHSNLAENMTSVLSIHARRLTTHTRQSSSSYFQGCMCTHLHTCTYTHTHMYTITLSLALKHIQFKII